MKRCTILALLTAGVALAAAAQTLTVSGPATAALGQTVQLTFTLAGSAGTSLAGLQWTFAPPAGLTAGVPVISAAGWVEPVRSACEAIERIASQPVRGL